MSKKIGNLYHIQKIAKYVEKTLNLGSNILMVVLALAVIVGVFTRNINLPIVWLGELGIFSSIWITFFGMALAYRHKMFPNVNFLSLFLPEKADHWLSVIWDVFTIIFVGIVLWSARDFMIYLADSGHVSSEMRIPIIYVYIGPVIGFICTLFFGILNMLEKISECKEGQI